MNFISIYQCFFSVYADVYWFVIGREDDFDISTNHKSVHQLK